MIKAKIDAKDAMKMLNNLVAYSDGFIKETKAKESTVVRKMANLSIDGFYEYLDGLARVNPGMLHHVYEWGQVGNPNERLVELTKAISGSKASISSEFLYSESVPSGAREPFYNKATVMEEGIPITIQATNAQAMFFEYGGQEFFRTGPITIENPGGEQTRGSFIRVFQEFYNTYFDRVYLRSIRFYDHFSSTKDFSRNFPAAVRSARAEGIGRATALSWIMKAPGDDYE